ncbi:MAG: S-methyl-5-thioribose-1-phosphate isomerase [Bacteroidales bacterium]|jgi:S-methyl-5-thioribose-1-phosphate isomerase|nr:S-methyl-5-thioribose-1-phosphate isomerase [Bacteroidales bacterium]MCK9449558.1 S-methyl-5-thioribose-1-phosphate isomerase [Bacteroidales bacterium]MDD3700737.1 S-methyl-5-thioribose-1-phosphate isomerase [Bacteroidales bacterium]MDY0369371.1 S-methyl-5-thioribose-1-phosphate isomerase [Bacteroidales bacterium]
MIVHEKNYQTVWMEGQSVFMIDQNKLPFEFEIHECKTYWDSCMAITDMTVRGAGAIGAAAGYAMAQAYLEAPEDDIDTFVTEARADIESTRPTARNLFYAVEKVFEAGKVSRVNATITAQKIAAADAEDSWKIGQYGNELIKKSTRILTHCNAGWLAFVDYGTALSPIYQAHKSGKEVFVYVDETRPRGQGARLTAWELQQQGVPHLIIPDNAAASLMADKKIDLIIVGADRIARNGDVANKIGTYGCAVLAHYHQIPFYVAAPGSTFDMECASGKDIIIEHRNAEEVLFQDGMDANHNRVRIRIASPGSNAYNPAFDITPARLITGIITEKGIIKAHAQSIKAVLKE